MEILLDKAWTIILALVGALSSLFWHFYRKTNVEIKHVSNDLSKYKEQQARDHEAHRSRISSEMSDLKAQISGVNTALQYINNNIAEVQRAIGQLAILLQDKNNGNK